MEKSNSTIQIYQKSRTTSPNGYKIPRNASNSTLSTTNQDVVRIYVPPADDMISSSHAVFQRERGDDEISQSSNRSSIIQVEYLSHVEPLEPNTHHSIDGSSINQPQQFYYYPNPKQTVPQSSSSRRGSMTRKTPSPLLNDLIVCDHMKVRRSNDDLNKENSRTFTRRMTSFEELANKSDSNSIFYAYETADHSTKHHSKNGSDNTPFVKKSTSYSYSLQRTEKQSSSDNNSGLDCEFLEDRRNDIRFSQEANDNSMKSYDRFFNSDDELEDDEIKQRASQKSILTHKKYISETDADEDDENSSNSPTSKSILNTPINDTMPLLSNHPDSNLKQQGAPALPSSSNSLRQKSKIPRPSNRGSNSNSLRKNSSVSSPDSESENYQFSAYRSNNSATQSIPYQQQLFHNESIEPSREKPRADNKIRIKINQKNWTGSNWVDHVLYFKARNCWTTSFPFAVSRKFNQTAKLSIKNAFKDEEIDKKCDLVTKFVLHFRNFEFA